MSKYSYSSKRNPGLERSFQDGVKYSEAPAMETAEFDDFSYEDNYSEELGQWENASRSEYRAPEVFGSSDHDYNLEYPHRMPGNVGPSPSSYIHTGVPDNVRRRMVPSHRPTRSQGNSSLHGRANSRSTVSCSRTLAARDIDECSTLYYGRSPDSVSGYDEMAAADEYFDTLPRSDGPRNSEAMRAADPSVWSGIGSQFGAHISHPEEMPFEYSYTYHQGQARSQKK
ncbi:hypothetical protein ABW20_dc0101892 [Dactylellina cionopaga]|nr:hypothetical protein ABW20_dc0101892 [Dactylellina cionopaga]